MEAEQRRNKVCEETNEQSSGVKEAGAKLAYSTKHMHVNTIVDNN